MDDSDDNSIGLADPGSFHPADLDLSSRDPLGYPGYREALERAAERAGNDESVVAGAATVDGRAIELALFDFSFMGGSMGEVAGERLARAMERAAARPAPFVLRTATGGARMQEGMRSLIQMPKVVAARLTLADAHQPFIAILGHPTTGGVLASVASLADVTTAEEQATIGFAGPRVAERITGQRLPSGSHTASFAYRHGLVDHVIAPDGVRPWLAHALACLAPDQPEGETQPPPGLDDRERVDAWQAVTAARARKAGGSREDTRDIFDAYIRLEGDRVGALGSGVEARIARLDGRRLLLLEAGDPLEPAAFKKAARCIDIAVRLDLPIVTLVDSAGADPSVASEQQGIAGSIARLSEKMLTAPVPVLSIVTGEGGSGGALAFATADRLIAYETSYFSVIGPEAAAEILWRDASRARDAARALKLTAVDLLDLGIADQVVPGGPSADSLSQVVTYHLGRLQREEPAADHPRRRRSRWRNTW